MIEGRQIGNIDRNRSNKLRTGLGQKSNGNGIASEVFRQLSLNAGQGATVKTMPLLMEPSCKQRHGVRIIRKGPDCACWSVNAHTTHSRVIGGSCSALTNRTVSIDP